MNNDLCFKIENFDLYLEKYLVDYDIPVFYVCKDKENNRYMVLCYDSAEMLYLVAKSNNSEIIQMFEKKITMKQIFQKAQKIWRVITGDDFESDKIEIVEFQNISPEDLPVEDSFFEMASRDVEEYYKTIKCEIEGYNLKEIRKIKPEIFWYMKNIQEYSVVIDAISSDYINKRKIEKRKNLLWNDMIYKQKKSVLVDWDNECCETEKDYHEPMITLREVVCCG